MICRARLFAPMVIGLLTVVVSSAAAPEKVKFTPIKWSAFQDRLAKNPEKAKFTLVDAWASNCGPCKENFPHLVAMHAKYGAKGLGVISLSLDDPGDKAALKAAEDFLAEKKATFPNFYVDEDYGVGYDKLDISAIPAVFLYDADGKEVRRFTMDDVDNQFTYAQVEEAVDAVLAGKPLPPEKGTKGK